MIPPVLEGSAVTPGVLSSWATCGPSSVPAAWTWPVISAVTRVTVLGESLIVSVSAYGRPGRQ
jgi:hypothetical protein